MNFYIQSACPDNFEENYLGFKEIYGKIFLFSFPKKISINFVYLHWGHQKHFSGRRRLFIYIPNLKY